MTQLGDRGSAVRGRGPLLAALAVVALVASLALAGPASAAKVSGKTILTPKAATFDALAAAGVTVGPAGKAGVNQKGIFFPIRGKGTNLNLDNLSGKIAHKGGLTFTGSGTSATLQNFVVKLGDRNVIRAEVAGDGKLRLANLNTKNAKFKQRGNKVVISNVGVRLAHKAAHALSALFGIPDLAGANLGKATVKVFLP